MDGSDLTTLGCPLYLNEKRQKNARLRHRRENPLLSSGSDRGRRPGREPPKEDLVNFVDIRLSKKVVFTRFMPMDKKRSGSNAGILSTLRFLSAPSFCLSAGLFFCLIAPLYLPPTANALGPIQDGQPTGPFLGPPWPPSSLLVNVPKTRSGPPIGLPRPDSEPGAPPASSPTRDEVKPAGPSPESAPQETLITVGPTPLEEIDEADTAPEDFFDLDALQPSSPTLPPEITYDVPIDINGYVKDYIVLFQTRLHEKFELWLSRSGRYLSLMKEIFRKNDLPEDLVFLALVESGFNPYAYSRSKAVGPWQFMKGTAQKYGLKVDRWLDERRDPIKSTEAAAHYLKDLFGMFNSWPLSLASYNAGEGRVMRALNRSKVKVETFWDLSASRYLRNETKHYVPKFMAATIIAKNPNKFGFQTDYKSPLAYDEVNISRQISLETAAKAAEISYEEIKELNPELRRGITPPNLTSYPLRLPLGKKELFLQNLSKIPTKQIAGELKSIPEITVQKHRVRRGENLSRLARRYRTSVAKLQEVNNLTEKNSLRAGSVLYIPTPEE